MERTIWGEEKGEDGWVDGLLGILGMSCTIVGAIGFIILVK